METLVLENEYKKVVPIFGWLVVFVALRSKSTAMVIAGRSVNSPNHTFSWAGLSKWLTSNLCTYFRL